jgi:hypothetical protein
MKSIYRKVLTTVVALLAAAFVLAFHASEAKAANPVELIAYGGQPQSGTQECLTLSSTLGKGPGSLGTVVIAPCTGAANQQWDVEYYETTTAWSIGGSPVDLFTIGQVVNGTAAYLTPYYLGAYVAPLNYGGTGFPKTADQIWGMVGNVLMPYGEGPNKLWAECLYIQNGSGLPLVNASCSDGAQNELFWGVGTATESVEQVINVVSGGNINVSLAIDESNGSYTLQAMAPGFFGGNENFYFDSAGHICNTASGHCIGYNTSTGAIAAVASGASGYDTTWGLTPNSGGVFIQSLVASNICLQFASETTGAAIQAATCTASNINMWPNFLPVGNSYSVINPVFVAGGGGTAGTVDTALCMDHSSGGALVETLTCNGSTEQEWYFTNGSICERSAGNCLGVNSAGYLNEEAAPGDQWSIIPTSGGWYIEHVTSGTDFDYCLYSTDTGPGIAVGLAPGPCTAEGPVYGESEIWWL